MYSIYLQVILIEELYCVSCTLLGFSIILHLSIDHAKSIFCFQS